MKKQNKAKKIGSESVHGEQTALAKIKLYPTESQIRERAYELHIARGGLNHPLIDWLQAEQELNVAMNRIAEGGAS